MVFAVKSQVIRLGRHRHGVQAERSVAGTESVPSLRNRGSPLGREVRCPNGVKAERSVAGTESMLVCVDNQSVVMQGARCEGL